jgi:hypothetical protein
MRPLLYWLPLILMAWSVSSGCVDDRCATRSCENGGVCIDGFCDCPPGFTGTNCELSLDPCDRQACDPNRSSSCVSNGEEARCICKDGFEGERCAQAWTTKFLRRYEVDEICNGTDQNFFSQIVEGPRFKQLTIQNFHNQTSAIESARIVAEMVTSNVAKYNDQFMTFGKVDGSVNYLDDGQLALSYTIITDTDTLDCVATYKPQ